MKYLYIAAFVLSHLIFNASDIATAISRYYDDDDIVGEIECTIYDIELDGFKIRRIDAEGFLTELD